MTRRLTAILSTSALVLGLIAPAPAVAFDNEELRRLMAGAAILGVLGLAVREQQEREEARREDDRRDRHDRDDDGWHDDRWDDRRGEHSRERHGHGHWNGFGRGHGHGRHARALPGSCIVAYHTRTGGLQLFDGACLARRYDGARHLPSACAVTIQRSGRYETGFDPRCLSGRGFQVAGQ